MLAVVIGILFAILLLVFVWYFSYQPTVVMIGGSKPTNPPNNNPTNPPTNPHEKIPAFQSNARQALVDFSVALFDKINNKPVVIDPLISRFVELLCGNNTFAKDTLHEYVQKVSLAMDVSSPRCGSGEHTPTDTEYLDDIRRLSNSLNGIFNECAKRNDKSFGLVFGILANRVLAYKLALDRGDVQKAEQIRILMIDHVQKMTL